MIKKILALLFTSIILTSYFNRTASAVRPDIFYDSQYFTYIGISPVAIDFLPELDEMAKDNYMNILILQQLKIQI